MTEQPSSGTGATPAPGSPATGNTSVGATPPKLPATLEEALARIAEIERHATNKEQEATRHGKSLSAAEKELAAYKEKERLAQEATLSEIEKATKHAQEVEAQLQQARRQNATLHIKLAAKDKGARNPDVVASHIESKLDYDKETGLPTNLEKVLEDLAKSDAYLFVSAEPAQSPAQTATPKPPQFTANAPGRQNIVQPGQAPQGTPYQPTRLTDVFKRP